MPVRPSRFSGGIIHKRKLRWAALVLAAILLMIYILVQKREVARFDWRLFGDTLLRLQWGWLALGSVLCLLTYYGRALRWAVLIKPMKPDPSIWNLTSATVVGFTALTLLGRPGEIVRPYLIAVKERVPVSSQIAAWLLERIFDMLVALVIFGIALSQVHASGAKVGPALSWVLSAGGWTAGILGALCLLLLLVIRQFAEPMRRRLLGALGFLRQHHYSKAERLVNAFVQGVDAMRTSRGMALLAGYTVLEWLLIGGCYYSVVHSFGPALPFGLLDTLIFMGFTTFGAVVQVPGVGGGIQIMTVLVLTELFGITLEIATGAAVLLWIIAFVVIVPFGLVLAVREGLSWKRLRRIEQEASW